MEDSLFEALPEADGGRPSFRPLMDQLPPDASFEERQIRGHQLAPYCQHRWQYKATTQTCLGLCGVTLTSWGTKS